MDYIVPLSEKEAFEQLTKRKEYRLLDIKSIPQEGAVVHEFEGNTMLMYRFENKGDFVTFEYYHMKQPALRFNWSTKKGEVGSYSMRRGVSINPGHDIETIIRNVVASFINVMCFSEEYRDQEHATIKDQHPDGRDVLVLIPSFVLFDQSIDKSNAPMGVKYEKVELDSSQSLEQQVSRHLANYYMDWLDHPVPALKGKTPRQASKTITGRKELENLFKHIQSQPKGSVPFPIEKIRYELGLE